MNKEALNIQEEQEDEINLLPILMALKKKLFLIIIVTVVAAALGYIGSKMLIAPTYRTSFTVYVNNNNGENGASSSLTSSDLNAAKSLANTYANIIEGRSVLLESASRCGLDAYTYNDLSDLVNASVSDDTEIITVYVKGSTPENALYLAQAVAQVAEGQISGIVDGSRMQVIDSPFLPETRYSPNNVKNGILVGLVAAVLVCAIIVIQALLDDRVKDEASLEDRYSIIVLGSIPNFNDAKKVGSSYYGYGEKKSK